jgi:hypothetical protein
MADPEKRVFSCSFLVVGSEKKKIQHSVKRQWPATAGEWPLEARGKREKDRDLTQRALRPEHRGHGEKGNAPEKVGALGKVHGRELASAGGPGPQMKTPRRESGRTFLQLKVYHKNNQLSRKIITKIISTLDT